MTETPDAAAIIEAPVLDKRLCQGSCTKSLRETGKGVARYGDPYLCGRCTSVLRSELSGLDTLAAVLQAEADGHRGSTGADAAIRAHRNAGTKGSPSPAYDLINELEDVLRQWVAVKRPIAARLGYIARPVTESASWLITNLNMYLQDPACAGNLAADVRKWHARLEKRAKAGTALIHKPVPCPHCKKRGLEQERGSQVVKCRECGLIRSVEQYEALAADGAESADGAAEEKPPARRRKAADPAA